MLMNLQTATPRITGFSVATKTQVPNNGPTIYAFGQCIETITQIGCKDCLNAQYNNMQSCLPNSDGRAFANGCFLRYSTTSFFPHNQILDVTRFSKQVTSKKGIIIGGVVAGGSLALILIALFSMIRRRKSPKMISIPRGDIPGASKLKGPVAFSYNVLKTATKNFSEENKIGEGGFGVVYKGTLWNGKVVAIKKLASPYSNKVDEEFESEVKLISHVHHRNLVRLLGCCSKGHDRILVYEYMKNNSLDKFLYGDKKYSLNWKQRYEVILGIARGLAYLHEEFHVRIIHRDIKTNNILLDDDLQPRIADFGLARLIPEDKTHLNTKFAGTLGYTSPEYAIHGQLSEKVDVYSYGIVVLEIISGQKCNKLETDGDVAGEYLLQKAWNLYERGMHLELVDNALDPQDYDADEVKKIIEIGLLCTQPSAETRPMMSEIMVMLKKKGLLENMRPTMPIFIETN
ncbi:cysteine-rich receptor-like protein kinase 42 isoform X2 [Neltuma alba]|uniref:cysteine-rich receptor-like protein kinase 42 isoform X2 n=1 Tax=Neltuma alba TaxID=207710 RepID=UPI0010A52D69|nr:cysteine-rich receptor-like protein kinase 42 isoform X2 [Prosopis alba]